MKTIFTSATILLFLVFAFSIQGQEKMIVEGAIQIANSEQDSTAAPGTIRFVEEIGMFQGWDSEKWVSLSDGKGIIRDIEGNAYKTVTIGEQEWMAKNLHVTKFKNGTNIPEVQLDTDWASTLLPAWCQFNHSDSLGQIYGKLYNYNAIIDTAGLCPNGWEIPSVDDWEELKHFLYDDQGRAVKERGVMFWNIEPDGTSNRTQFSARGSGYRRTAPPSFVLLTNEAYYWTTGVESTAYRLYSAYSSISKWVSTSWKYGYAVRCIKE